MYFFLAIGSLIVSEINYLETKWFIVWQEGHKSLLAFVSLFNDLFCYACLFNVMT